MSINAHAKGVVPVSPNMTRVWFLLQGSVLHFPTEPSSGASTPRTAFHKYKWRQVAVTSGQTRWWG